MHPTSSVHICVEPAALACMCASLPVRALDWGLSNSVKGWAGCGVVSFQIRELSPFARRVINGSRRERGRSKTKEAKNKGMDSVQDGIVCMKGMIVCASCRCAAKSMDGEPSLIEPITASFPLRSVCRSFIISWMVRIILWRFRSPPEVFENAVRKTIKRIPENPAKPFQYSLCHIHNRLFSALTGCNSFAFFVICICKIFVFSFNFFF